MFRSSNARLRFQPEAGQKVVIRAKLSLYEARGDYQLIAETMEPAGAGDLARAFEELKAKLNAEGLFDPAWKLPLPDLPKHIAVVTSPTGAAIQDILTVLRRRHAGIAVTILPVAVQGQSAAAQIAKAITLANQLTTEAKTPFDAIIVGRGGGSQEDLWAFNEEVVARAIYASNLPIISAVGHEIDFTIADFCADVRAATPSQAAELISPDVTELTNTVEGYKLWLISHIKYVLQQHSQQLTLLSAQLKHPGSRLNEQQQRLDELEIRMRQAWQKSLSHQQHRAEILSTQLQACHPGQLISTLKLQLKNIFRQLKQASKQDLQRKQQNLQLQIQRLNTISPLATLERGYAIVTQNNGTPVTSSDQIDIGETLNAKLATGQLSCIVESINK
jgi:exodeoxyribonuclease VII large subunit